MSFAVVVSTSGAGLGGAPGAAWGHTGNVVWPGGGCHAGFWANTVAEKLTITTRKKAQWRIRGLIINLQRRIVAQPSAAKENFGSASPRSGIYRGFPNSAPSIQPQDAPRRLWGTRCDRRPTLCPRLAPLTRTSQLSRRLHPSRSLAMPAQSVRWAPVPLGARQEE